jgi:hypothetical protein
MDIITVLLIAFGGFTALYAAGWIVVSWAEGQRHNMLGGPAIDRTREPKGSTRGHSRSSP